ncbi:MAG TPA: hypothetical protein VLA19_23415, partial [Herpetosiphonaceae bacterium]|nr:hypothetical protein [Herpetosiphonaceae bacterium]
VALRRRWGAGAGLCLVLLPTKPQAGLIFALAGACWALRYHRRSLWWAVMWGILLWGGAFLVEPGWVQGTLAAILRYKAAYTDTLAISLLPGGLLVLLAAYRLQWWAIAAAAQVVLFPIHDLYGALPLLVAWAGVGGLPAIIGAAWSWLWVFLYPGRPMPSVLSAHLWLSLLLPFVLASGWRAYTRPASPPRTQGVGSEQATTLTEI